MKSKCLIAFLSSSEGEKHICLEGSDFPGRDRKNMEKEAKCSHLESRKVVRRNKIQLFAIFKRIVQT